MIRAVLDPALSATIVSERPLVYSEPAAPGSDRPPHVRAASGLVACDGRIVVAQDDASFLAVIEGDRVRALELPAGPGGRRRFEQALGNKLDKLDLEGCLALDGEMLAFGSGSIEGVRDRIARLAGDTVELVDGAALYAAVRAAIGGPINVEGVARAGDALWLFHRGNTGPADRPAIVVVALDAIRGLLARGEAPAVREVIACDLGTIRGVRFGFTDAATDGDRLYVACAAEASPDAIEDGEVIGSIIGVLEGDTIRCAPIADRAGRPIKIEGLAVEGDRAWVTIDPDDVAVPAPLYEIVLAGPWRNSGTANAPVS